MNKRASKGIHNVILKQEFKMSDILGPVLRRHAFVACERCPVGCWVFIEYGLDSGEDLVF